MLVIISSRNKIIGYKNGVFLTIFRKPKTTFILFHFKRQSFLFVSKGGRTGVTADLDPPRIWTPRSRSASGFGPPGPNPLADMDPLSQIWTPLKTSVLLSKIGKIVFLQRSGHQNRAKVNIFMLIYALVLLVLRLN